MRSTVRQIALLIRWTVLEQTGGDAIPDLISHTHPEAAPVPIPQAQARGNATPEVISRGPAHCETTSAPPPFIGCKVVDQSSNEVYFKIKGTSKFSKLFKAYCENRGIETQNIHFILDGSRLRGDDTPETIELQEGAVISAFPEAKARAHRSEQEPDVKITIKNRTKVAADEPVEPEVSFKFPRTRCPGQVFEMWNDSQLRDSLDTAESLGLEDGGIIDAIDELSRFVPSEKETDLDSIPRHITITVVDSIGEVFYKIKRTKMLGKLIDMHINYRSVDPDTAYFLSNGLQVLREDTAATLGLAEGAVIHAFFAEEHSSPAPDLENPNPADERKTLRIQVQNERQDEFHFKVESTALMKKVMDAYCKLQFQDRDVLRFVFDGIRIQDQDTPNLLNMEEGDIIDVWTELRGGVGTPEPEAPKALGEVKHINIRVKDQDSNEVRFKIKSTTSLKKVMDAYCQRQGLQRDALRFLFDGDRVQDNDTPESRELEDDDCLEVFVQQLGGSGDGDSNTTNSDHLLVGNYAANPHINIRIADVKGENELTFRFKKSTLLKKVMDAWAERQGTTRDVFGFLFQGSHILDDETPESLDMKNNDLLQAFKMVRQTPVKEEPKNDSQNDVDFDHINVKVTDLTGNEQFFRIKKDEPLGKLMKAWCDKSGKIFNTVRFVFEGHRFLEPATPSSLDMDEGDIIEVYWEQLAGNAEQEGEEVKPEAEPQIMSIKVRNTNQDEMTFKIKDAAKLGKLMKACAVQQGRSPDTLRFFLRMGSASATPTLQRCC